LDFGQIGIVDFCCINHPSTVASSTLLYIYAVLYHQP
jgi:hypothetical protein